jgi:hypothetical protein
VSVARIVEMVMGIWKVLRRDRQRGWLFVVGSAVKVSMFYYLTYEVMSMTWWEVSATMEMVDRAWLADSERVESRVSSTSPRRRDHKVLCVLSLS